MAGDWLKVEKHTPEKPEVLAVAAMLNISVDEAFGKCFRLWRWADSQLTDGNAARVTVSAVDQIVGRSGFAEALIEVGWLKARSGSISIPNFDRHMSESAKARALTAKRVSEFKRRKGNGEVTSDALPEQEESKRESQLLMSNRKAIGSSSAPMPVAPVAHRLPKDAQGKEGKAIDLSMIDWSLVEARAEELAKKVPPITPKDRRNWLRFAVMTQLAFSEDWLVDSTQAVVNAKETRRTKQAHLYGVLKAKAVEDGLGDLFSSMLRDIEIPKEIWTSGVLGGAK